MANRRKKIIEEQSDSAVSQSEDDNYNNNHNKKRVKIESSNITLSKQLLLDELATFKMRRW